MKAAIFFIVCALTGFSACQQTPPPPSKTPTTRNAASQSASQPTPTAAHIGRVVVAEISFTGPGLSGVPTYDPWNDLNGNNIVDPGEPYDDTLIMPPEYVAGTSRNKHGYFLTDTQIKVKARFLIEVPDTANVNAFAICTDHPELSLGSVGKVTYLAGTHYWEGIFQVPAIMTEIDAYEGIFWNWSIIVDGTTYRDTTQHSLYFSVGTGEPL